MEPREAFVALGDAVAASAPGYHDAVRLAPFPMQVMEILTYVPESIMDLIVDEYCRWLTEAR